MPFIPLSSRAAGVVFAVDSPVHDSALSALHHTAATAGFLAYGLMVGTVCWGILTTTHLARRGIRRQTLYGGHMTMAIMTISFIVIHIAGNIFSPAVALGPLNAIIPFFPGSSTGVTMGVVGTELAIAIAVSVWFQRRLGYRTWHLIHWLAYPSYVLSIAHTVVTGSDVRAGLVATALAASFLSVVALFVLRALPSTSLVRNRFAPAEY
jgi:DMSO/TMAO reductase YedYZ heme-binding membrane subunit